MLKVTLIAVGKLKNQWAAEGCDEYLKRLKAYGDVRVLEIPASKEKDPEKQLQEESKKLLEQIAKLQGDVWLLDEKGKDVTSEQFSGMLSKSVDTGTHLTFVLGGSYGTSEALKRSIPKKLRLSAMTLPHELCRVLFLEQLYRGFEIAKGTGYHH